MSSLHHSVFHALWFSYSHLNLYTQELRQSFPTNHLFGSKDVIFFFKNNILPLYYAAYQAHHFLFLSVVHSCLLPPHSSCSLHHLSYPTFKEFSCL